MNEKYEMDIIIALLSKWIVQIEMNNALTLYDINKISESLAMKMLNILYGLELRNLNITRANFCGIDLGDDIKSKIAFQVTSRTDAAKVRSTLKNFVDRGYNKKYTSGVRFLILSRDKVKFGKDDLTTIYCNFNVNEHIITYNDLIRDISCLYSEDYSRFCKLKEFLITELSVNSATYQILKGRFINELRDFFNRDTLVKLFLLFISVYPILYGKFKNPTAINELYTCLTVNALGLFTFVLLILAIYILLKLSDNNFKRLLKKEYPEHRVYESDTKKLIKTTIHKDYCNYIQKIVIHNEESEKIDHIKGSIVLFENNVEIERVEYEEYNIEPQKGKIVYKMKYNPEDRFEKMYWNEFDTYIDEIEMNGKIKKNIILHGIHFLRTHFLLLNKFNYLCIGGFRVLPYELSWLKQNLWTWRIKSWFFYGHSIPKIYSFSGKPEEPTSYKYIRLCKKVLRILVLILILCYLYISFKSLVLILIQVGHLWHSNLKLFFL